MLHLLHYKNNNLVSEIKVKYWWNFEVNIRVVYGHNQFS